MAKHIILIVVSIIGFIHTLYTVIRCTKGVRIIKKSEMKIRIFDQYGMIIIISFMYILFGFNLYYYMKLGNIANLLIALFGLTKGNDRLLFLINSKEIELPQNNHINIPTVEENRKKSYIKNSIWILMLIMLALYFFIPRPLKNVLHIESMAIDQISEIYINVPSKIKGDWILYSFTEESDIKKLMELFQKTKVKRRIIRKDFVSSYYMGYSIAIGTKEDEFRYSYLFTEDIISVDDRQYDFYSNEFSQELKLIIDKSRQ